MDTGGRLIHTKAFLQFLNEFFYSKRDSVTKLLDYSSTLVMDRIGSDRAGRQCNWGLHLLPALPPSAANEWECSWYRFDMRLQILSVFAPEVRTHDESIICIPEKFLIVVGPLQI